MKQLFVFFIIIFFFSCKKEPPLIVDSNYCNIQFSFPETRLFSYKWENVSVDTFDLTVVGGGTVEEFRLVKIKAITYEQDTAKKILEIVIPFELYVGPSRYELGDEYYEPTISYIRYVKIDENVWKGVKYTNYYADYPQESAFFNIYSINSYLSSVIAEDIELYPLLIYGGNENHKAIIKTSFNYIK